MPAGVAIALAALPVAALAALVLRGRGLGTSAWAAVALAAALALTAFGLDLAGLGLAAVRGAWTGGWILLIVLPALLLFEVLDRSGALGELGDTADRLAPTPGRQALLLAWVLPSFLQGAAGFGAPIAMAAPLLVRRGWAPVAAVATCLVGYQWAVTFGSMGSSYFMAEATARLDEAAAGELALRAAAMLAVSALVAGALVLRRAGRAHGDAWRLIAIGAAMGAALIGVVAAQPALGSTAAGLAGLGAAWWLLPDRGTDRPGGRALALAALPYVVLTAASVIGLGVPAVRAWLADLATLAPTLPGSQAGGHATPAGPLTPALSPLLHPVSYVLLAVLVAVVVYRRVGWWPWGTTRAAARRWGRRIGPLTRSIVGLTVLAAVLEEAGMVAALADGLRAGLGGAFLLVSGPLGALGAALTGSTTASNALFASLQAQIAEGLQLPPALLVASQTAGGNVGNALAPAVIAVGLAAAGGSGREGEVLRRNLPAAGVLLAVGLAALLVQAVLV